MQRYFLKQTKIIDGGFELSSEVAHHFVTVMRAQVGDLAEFVLDDGVEVVAQLIKVDGKRAWVQVDHEITTSSELPVNVTLACGVPKGEKAQLIVQKATELGVDKIIFFEAERSISRWHSDRRQKKIEKLVKVARGAAEQSHRTVIPQIVYQTDLLQAVNEAAAEHQIVAWEESAKQGEQSNLSRVFHQMQNGDTLLAVIGPEGGLTEDEIKRLTDRDVIPAGLGPRILRTETAPLYLLAAISYYFELEK
ncbi:RsmE family RNA methyltransferase [Paucilactobacillus vaccinostercus DSM 20634]|uniref:Ribosomal RNA small subunit methyltransferase E n=1 Tax=Paucilactobacillus vaccinostercus DSM 20634 TaxID=1423813 RepID=A0A0R2ADY2_9LACO|nr:16S rRNA (uracil(1498)-N(3))-methyltransferase [Paucilactobacillus vaccinostercus]KRM62475.1 RsmE family RNA methyltransferase [Paucilactobacillus vaccinostercus DSM 20634]